MRHSCVVVLALLVGAASPSAQTAPLQPDVEFLSRAAFHMTAERVSGGEDERFRWDADFGGELDVVDYGVGRLTFVANYEVIMGDELRRFDPNQGNYILEGSASARLRATEVAGVFYHQSRHLSDRSKTFAVDWNSLGVRARRTFLVGQLQLHAGADFRGVLKRSHVDYRWELEGRLRGDRALHSRIGAFVGGAVRHVGTDGSRNRDSVTGFRGEGGVRLEGRAAAVELFVAGERRIDPYQLEFTTATWALAGFRLLTR